MAQDLRSFIDLVKRGSRDDFASRLEPRSIPPYELTALVVKLEREAQAAPRAPVRAGRGTRFPVLTNLHASRGVWPPP